MKKVLQDDFGIVLQHFYLYCDDIGFQTLFILEKSVFQIFHGKTELLAILFYCRSAVAPNAGGAVYDPVSDEFGIVTEFYYLQRVTSVEYPFSDVFNTGWDFDFHQLAAFEKGTVFDHFQRIRKCERFQPAEIKGFFSDRFQ